jgi:hypothetical protein
MVCDLFPILEFRWLGQSLSRCLKGLKLVITPEGPLNFSLQLETLLQSKAEANKVVKDTNYRAALYTNSYLLGQ